VSERSSVLGLTSVPATVEEMLEDLVVSLGYAHEHAQGLTKEGARIEHERVLAIIEALRRVPVEHREPVGDLRKVLVKFGYRVVEVCARAEGFDNYAHSDWGIDFTEALNATLTEMGARPPYRAPSERVGE
jgi:hypothetical protein